ncbi:MAG: hypothetical protein EXR82_02340 [Gammaproteobacteria bacterium]|nr:hypothetical protein [Gammaproteobacteria bacterium]
MKCAVLFCLSALPVACGPPPEPPAANVIGDPLEKSLDKARAAESLNSQRKDGLDEAVDAAN